MGKRLVPFSPISVPKLLRSFQQGGRGSSAQCAKTRGHDGVPHQLHGELPPKKWVDCRTKERYTAHAYWQFLECDGHHVSIELFGIDIGSLSAIDSFRRSGGYQAWRQKFHVFLQRPPLSFSRKRGSDKEELALAKKFLNHVSLKGEDILVHSSVEEQLKFHRLRASIPSQCWRWLTVAGWGWKGDPEHINCLELRAILTSVRWWIEKRKVTRAKFIHLTDSLVCMHSLARGRTSSRKLRRTLTRINCLLLASRCFQNPADRPSRRSVRKKWVK